MRSINAVDALLGSLGVVCLEAWTDVDASALSALCGRGGEGSDVGMFWRSICLWSLRGVRGGAIAECVDLKY